jgi:hypothetical protein
MIRIVLAVAAAALVTASLALADPRPSWSTCAHDGISSTVTKRHVNYLSVQTWLGCAHAQHVARIWVHDHACGISACNIWDNGTAIAYCTSSKDSGTTNEWTTRCTKSGSTAVLVGWVKTG